MADESLPVRCGGVADAASIARLLHEFNTEFATPSPGPDVLTDRLVDLLDSDTTFAVLAGDPPAALALVTLRSNVWYPGPVALLDEMYVTPELRGRGIGSAVLAGVLEEASDRGVQLVEINVDEGDVAAQRFYARHGFRDREPETGERACYFWQELGT